MIYQFLFLYLIDCHFVRIYIVTPTETPNIAAMRALPLPASMYKKLEIIIFFY